MKLQPIVFLLGVMLFASSQMFSQKLDTFSGADFLFFQKRALDYQRWLENTQLTDVLEVERIRVKKNNTQLDLVLNLKTQDPDSAASMWQQLRLDYSSVSSGLQLEVELFRIFIHLMEIPAQQGSLGVYIPDSTGRHNYCFYVGISEEDGDLKQDIRLSNCRSEPVEVRVSPVLIKKVVKGKTVQTSRVYTAEEVFSEILVFAKQYEKIKPDCAERYPVISNISQSGTNLKFIVSDLCQVVLKEEKKSLWCELVTACGGVCNDTRRERLEFNIEYSLAHNKLTCHILGKFGSGVYKPRRDGWFNMEPDFVGFLEEFQQEFKMNLEKHLNRQ